MMQDNYGLKSEVTSGDFQKKLIIKEEVTNDDKAKV